MTSFLTVVCADKGSPGASTLALLLSAAHPNRALLVEGDPAGGDLAQRLFATANHMQPSGANLLALASASRRSNDAYLVGSHAGMTPSGVRLVEGLANADQQIGLAPLWSPLTAALVASDDDVIVDLGRLSAVHPGLGLVTAANRVFLVLRPDLEQLLRLRDRVHQLLALIGGDTSRLVVVVVAPEKTAQRDLNATAHVLSDSGAGDVQVQWFPFSPKEIAAFYTGHLSARSYLWRSATGLAATLTFGDIEETQSQAHIPAATLATATTTGDPAWTTS